MKAGARAAFKVAISGLALRDALLRSAPQGEGLEVVRVIRSTSFTFTCQTARRASSPRVSSGPRACRSSVPSFAVGACGTTGRFTAPAAPARVCMRAARMPFSAHGRWSSPTPKIAELNRASEADLRLRSAREWTLRLAASLTGNCRLRRPRPDRASCRTGMHLDRPPVTSASISCPTADPRLSPVIRSIQARHRSGHRIPLRVSMTIATRPSPERDGPNDISPTARVKNKKRT